MILFQNFYLQMGAMEKKSLFLELIWVHLCIMIKRGKYYYSKWRTNIRIRWYNVSNRIKTAINFTQSGKRFVLSLHYNGSNSFLFVNATKVYQLKAKNAEIKYYSLYFQKVLQLIIWKNRLKGVVKLFFCWF